MKRSFLAVSVCLSMPVSAAQAWDWSVKSTLSETVELNDNQFMRQTPLGSIGSYSFLKSDILVQRPTSKFILDGDIRYSKYFGPGAENTPLAETTSMGAHARFEDKLKYGPDKNYIDASWRRQNISMAILDDIGFATNAKGNLDTTTLQGGIERSITSNDFITLSSRGTSIDYVPKSGGTHYTDLLNIGTWKHQINPNTALLSSTELEFLNYDNATQTNTFVARQTAGLQSQLTALLYFRGTAGIAYVNIRQENASVTATPTGSSPTLATSGSAEGFLGDALLTYKLFKTTDLSLYARQTIAPSVVGNLQQRQSFGTSLHHNINHSSSVTLSGDLTRQKGAESSTDFYTASIAYNYQLTREWNTQLSYRFQYRVPTTGSTAASSDPITGAPIATSGNDPVMSNAVLLVITRNFTELPPGR